MSCTTPPSVAGVLVFSHGAPSFSPVTIITQYVGASAGRLSDDDGSGWCAAATVTPNNSAHPSKPLLSMPLGYGRTAGHARTVGEGGRKRRSEIVALGLAGESSEQLKSRFCMAKS